MDIGGSTVSVQVGTGRILVMAENRTFNQSLKGGGRGTTAINYAVDQKYGGSAYGFQGGSTYKPFTLMNWLQNGHGLEDVLNATPNPEPRPVALQRQLRTGRMGWQVRPLHQ